MKLILTTIGNAAFCGLYREGRFLQIDLKSSGHESEVGNIYVGRIQNIVKNIGAVFVEYQKGKIGYLRLSELKHPYYVQKKGSSDTPVIGDELLVEITRDAIKTKPPSLSSVLNFTSPNVVLRAGDPTIGISSKITSGEEKKRLKAIARFYQTDQIGFILRTASAGMGEEDLKNAFEAQLQEFHHLLQLGTHATAFTCLRRASSQWLSAYRADELASLEEIVTDSLILKEELEDEVHLQGLNAPIRLYEDEISLARIYQIDTVLDRASFKRVWLSSGAYLVIEQTEALSVIDVNTGKAIHGAGASQETFLKINLEAAKEAARQIRLRNLGGIILVDFIDLSAESAKKSLLKALAGFVEEDPTPCQVVDMTKLQLVELTRKTIRPSLKEQMESLT
ncbi:MAG: ribonuclease E/G [Lachnospiraceae bacterium]|nr:ribonuclease E/G [Lachnospiraceae bacterium]